MIIGTDWLEAFSPMKVDWHDKWMKIPYGLDHIVLRGLLPDFEQSTLPQLCHIASSVSSTDSSVVPPAVQQLIDEYVDLFKNPLSSPRIGHATITFRWSRALLQWQSVTIDTSRH
jgi:hypothetical protein